VKIDILKNIPVAAGLAGGSGNGAAVILGLNHLWELGLNVEEMCKVAAMLGSDVPFTLMGQAKGNTCLGEKINNDKLATTCALATGTGTEMMPLPAIKKDILLSKPSISVSTAEVYKGMKLDELSDRPNNKELIEALENGDFDKIKANMINVLEQYTLANYDMVVETKNKIKEACPTASVLMSGSGPTVFAIVEDNDEMMAGYNVLKGINKATYITKTI
jgi:4-diphosphocytidyl-2-C-methyl-D-erythritol kinase